MDTVTHLPPDVWFWLPILKFGNWSERSCAYKCGNDTVKYNFLRAESKKKLDHSNRSPYKDREITVELLAEYMTVRKIRQSKRPVELIAELGGYLGLFVGVSILTLAEMVELLWLIGRKIILGICTNIMRRSKVGQDLTTIKVTTTSEV